MEIFKSQRQDNGILSQNEKLSEERDKEKEGEEEEEKEKEQLSQVNKKRMFICNI